MSKQRKSRRGVWIFVTVVLVIAAGVGIGIFAWYWQSGTQAPPVEREPVATTAVPVTEPTSAEPTETTRPLVDNPVDFATLQATNPDVCAWLHVPNTNIDYPVAQATDQDDSFYLNHNIYKNYEFAGMIYSEKQNARDFTDRMTVLYGHNMLNGTMFRTLHYFEDEEFFNENSTFTVYTPGHILTYTIFAAYEYDNRHLLNSFNFSDDSVWAAYLQEARSPRTMSCHQREGITLGLNDKIVTLSTCVGYSHDYRYLVQGVLTDDQPTK